MDLILALCLGWGCWWPNYTPAQTETDNAKAEFGPTARSEGYARAEARWHACQNLHAICASKKKVLDLNSVYYEGQVCTYYIQGDDRQVSCEAIAFGNCEDPPQEEPAPKPKKRTKRVVRRK